MKGISREHTFWCGVEECCVWRQFAIHFQRDAIKTARRHGWRYTPSEGWVCPRHKKTKEK